MHPSDVLFEIQGFYV